jgi:hypothetical protein
MRIPDPIRAELVELLAAALVADLEEHPELPPAGSTGDTRQDSDRRARKAATPKPSHPERWAS